MKHDYSMSLFTITHNTFYRYVVHNETKIEPMIIPKTFMTHASSVAIIGKQ